MFGRVGHKAAEHNSWDGAEASLAQDGGALTQGGLAAGEDLALGLRDCERMRHGPGRTEFVAGGAEESVERLGRRKAGKCRQQGERGGQGENGHESTSGVEIGAWQRETHRVAETFRIRNVAVNLAGELRRRDGPSSREMLPDRDRKRLREAECRE